MNFFAVFSELVRFHAARSALCFHLREAFDSLVRHSELAPPAEVFGSEPHLVEADADLETLVRETSAPDPMLHFPEKEEVYAPPVNSDLRFSEVGLRFVLSALACSPP